MRNNLRFHKSLHQLRHLDLCNCKRNVSSMSELNSNVRHWLKIEFREMLMAVTAVLCAVTQHTLSISTRFLLLWYSLQALIRKANCKHWSRVTLRSLSLRRHQKFTVAAETRKDSAKLRMCLSVRARKNLRVCGVCVRLCTGKQCMYDIKTHWL